LVGDRGLRRRRGSCLSFRLGTTWGRVGIRVRARGCSRATAIEDGGSAPVVFFRPIFLLVRHRVSGVRFSNHGIGVRNVNRTTAGEELATLTMMTMVDRRVWIHRK